MKLHEALKYRGFVICRGVLTQGDSFVNPNRSAAGEYNQLLYMVAGCGLANGLQLEEGKLNDLSAFKDQEIVYTSTAPVSLWAAFNPLLKGTRLDVRVVNRPTSETLQNDSAETFIVPLEGIVHVNGRELKPLQQGRLFIGKTGELTVPEGSVCSLVNIIRE